MKRCQVCAARAYPAATRCQRCGVTIEPSPPRWLRTVVAVFWPLCFAAVAFHCYQGIRMLLAPEPTDSVAVIVRRVAVYLWIDGAELAGMLLAFVVVPLVSLALAFRAFIDLGDWLDLKVQQWRAERFRKCGW